MLPLRLRLLKFLVVFSIILGLIWFFSTLLNIAEGTEYDIQVENELNTDSQILC